MNLTYAITTAPRLVCTLDYTLASLRKAGFGNPAAIFAQPGSVISPRCEAAVVIHEKRIGQFANWRAALSGLVKTTSTEYVAVFQDDVEFKKNSDRVLNERLTHSGPELNIGFLSLFFPAAYRPSKCGHGWNYFPCVPVYGAQALVFSRAMAARVLDMCRNDSLDSLYVDDALTVALAGSNLVGGWYKPSLCRHLGGDISTCRNFSADSKYGMAFNFTQPSTLTNAEYAELLEKISAAKAQLLAVGANR